MNASNSLQSNWKNDGAPQSLGIALLGLDRGLKRTLELFLSARFQNRFQFEPEESRADILIIDFDSREGKKSWELHAAQSLVRPIILLSQSASRVERAELVTKPLGVSALQAALVKSRERLQQQPEGKVLQPVAASQAISQKPAPAQTRMETPHNETECSDEQPRMPPQPISRISTSRNSGMWLNEQWGHALTGLERDLDAAAPQQPDSVQYDPKKYLVGRVLDAYQTAKKKNCAVCLKHERGSFTLFPGDHRVLVWMPEQYLSSLAAAPMDDESLSVSELTIGSNSGLNPLDPQHDLDALLWKLALIACRGRYPVGTDPEAPIVLKSWPDLTRLRAVPHAARMAEMWHRNPHSLLATAKVLDIPQKHVFAFYSATHLMGLAATLPGKGRRKNPAKIA